MATAEFNSGTAGGLLAFLEYLSDKGIATRAAVDPLRSAAQVIFAKMEGENFEGMDIQGLDEETYLDQFGNKFRTDYRPASLASYRRRFIRAIDLYRGFLADPEWRYPTSRRANAGATAAPRPAQRAAAGTPGRPRSEQHGADGAEHAEPADGVPGQGLTTFTFPLRGGTLAGYLRLPLDLSQRDADRLSAFVQTLVSEPTPSAVQDAGSEPPAGDAETD